MRFVHSHYENLAEEVFVARLRTTCVFFEPLKQKVTTRNAVVLILAKQVLRVIVIQLLLAKVDVTLKFFFIPPWTPLL